MLCNRCRILISITQLRSNYVISIVICIKKSGGIDSAVETYNKFVLPSHAGKLCTVHTQRLPTLIIVIARVFASMTRVSLTSEWAMTRRKGGEVKLSRRRRRSSVWRGRYHRLRVFPRVLPDLISLATGLRAVESSVRSSLPLFFSCRFKTGQDELIGKSGICIFLGHVDQLIDDHSAARSTAGDFWTARLARATFP